MYFIQDGVALAKTESLAEPAVAAGPTLTTSTAPAAVVREERVSRVLRSAFREVTRNDLSWMNASTTSRAARQVLSRIFPRLRARLQTAEQEGNLYFGLPVLRREDA